MAFNYSSGDLLSYISWQIKLLSHLLRASPLKKRAGCHRLEIPRSWISYIDSLHSELRQILLSLIRLFLPTDPYVKRTTPLT